MRSKRRENNFKKENKVAKKKAPGRKRGPGRPPNSKKPTLLRWIYAEIDKRIEKDVFCVLDNILKCGKKPDASAKEQEMALRVAQDLLDRRLPKEQAQGMPRTIIIKNHVPYPGENQDSEVVITTGGSDT